MSENVITSYKGFDKNMKCRGFQYEVGKEYEMDGEIKCCRQGFHACKSPMEVWDYYDMLSSRYAEVEQSGKIDKEENSTKVCSSRIKIKAELKLADIIDIGVEWLKEITSPSKVKKDGALNDNGDRKKQIGSSGDSAQIGSSGDYAQIGSSGDSAQIGSSGDYAQIGQAVTMLRLVQAVTLLRLVQAVTMLRLVQAVTMLRLVQAVTMLRLVQAVTMLRLVQAVTMLRLVQAVTMLRLVALEKIPLLCVLATVQ